MLLGQDPFRNALGGVTAGRLSPPDGPLAAGPTVQCITRAFHGWWGRVSTDTHTDTPRIPLVELPGVEPGSRDPVARGSTCVGSG